VQRRQCYHPRLSSPFSSRFLPILRFCFLVRSEVLGAAAAADAALDEAPALELALGFLCSAAELVAEEADDEAAAAVEEAPASALVEDIVSNSDFFTRSAQREEEGSPSGHSARRLPTQVRASQPYLSRGF
jgi:hypothetical protein